jgi:tRNA 2-thiouridine synthesizing protein A
MATELDISLTIDTCGTRCPIPILKAKIALKQLQAGELLKVLATDPAAKSDFEAMLRHLPHELVDYNSVETANSPESTNYKRKRVDTFIIRKG